MGKKGMSSKERREYERLQEQKKRQIERRHAKSLGLDNPAKSAYGGGRAPKENRHRRKPAEKRRANFLGNLLLILQAAASVVFMGMVSLLNIIPFKYLAVIMVCLLLLWLIGFISQIRRRKRGAGGKVYIMLMTLFLGMGSYYIGIVTGALAQITGGNSKIDTMVVAVPIDDPAENISDTSSYVFGVQYAMNGKDVKETVSHINEELGTEIETSEYSSVSEQARALHEGSVEAIIYNEGYKGILEEEFDGYSDKVKIIYKYNIRTSLDDVSVDVKVKTEPFSVYISGIDVYGEITTNSRSDVNIIATVNPKTRQILLVTTPRDYYVPIPGISQGSKDKLTHAGIYGVDASIRTLSELYDVDIPFYARVNFTSLVDIVDKLGGVEVNSEYAFTTSRDSGKVMKVSEGLNSFNGVEALAFARERKNIPGGDNQRGKNQQAVITAMIKKMVSPAMLLKANGIINSVSGNVETNMSQKQLQTLIKMQLNEGGSWNIRSVAAEGTGDRQYCYSAPGSSLYVTQPDYESIDAITELIRQVENGEILQETESTE